ncbi:hypothetical protein [Chromohalobacter nigrandesensis]|uniref:hypothetical protein n=1 Tax=Chromohalobacter nigrandesensis TaxID=119863 RepID=UPI001FF679F5|nr:hypothetical protein [Chromohalobacter nigrandesensis]MCK0743597.1 hypothetical protein [Chromohalobacter nigrandesensis]
METNPHAFTQMLAKMRRGQSAEELSETLLEAQDACKETGKQAVITYKVKIKPEKGMPGMFMLTDEIKSQLPQMDRGASVMFEDTNLQLQLEDPRQQKFDLKRVEDEKQEARTVAEEEKPTQLKKV